jgi:membrane protease YdiL (CAAX protease family)
MKKKFLTLLLAGIVSTVLALPYIFALQHEVISQVAMPLWKIGFISVVQSAVLLAVAVFFGLRLADKISLSALKIFDSNIPLKENLKRIGTLSIPLGIATALIIKLGDSFFTEYIPELVVTAEQIPFWKALLVAPYGGVVEELLLRLFIVSLFAWLLGIIFKSAHVVKNSTIMWTAIILASLLFGLGHLPATATILPLTPIVVVRAILLNGIGGLVFGWLYWKRGLEYSIVAHFTTDIVLHAVLISLVQ